MTDSTTPDQPATGDGYTPYFITTAIPYVNARPHIGFALEIIQTDTFARYHRQRGEDVYFLTGSDENSLKNVQAAEAEGRRARCVGRLGGGCTVWAASSSTHPTN